MPSRFRNIAIIAHIDHGKTTLLNALLKQSNLFANHEVVPDRVMDSYEQERERGITIFAKHTCIPYKEYFINIIDTPGHSDFSGEVERVLGMVSSVLLLVDAQDGPMPQTRFVLSKALKMGLRPIVVINKIDRPHANPDKALNATFDLFVELGANDEQLDFKYCYASALSGFALAHLPDERKDMAPLFDLILSAVPPPKASPDRPFLMQAMTMHYDDYLGRQATGCVLGGSLRKGDKFIRIDAQGNQTPHTATRIEGFRGIRRIELPEAIAGDIVSISGAPEIMPGDTLCSPEKIEALPPIRLDEPTLSIRIMVNSSPLAGLEGKNVTFSKIKERLFKEKRANLSLRIEECPGEEAMSVYGRGELQLGVLLEAMRREGLEMTVSKPQVLLKEIQGVTYEPVERVFLEVPEEFSGSVIEDLSRRKGEMQKLETTPHGISMMEFLVPTRGIMGYRNTFLTATRGLGIMTSLFEDYIPWKGPLPKRLVGVLVSINQGKATAYAIGTLQKRGTLFIGPGDEVYEGMIVGEHCREGDLGVNITRPKQLTNVRASGADENVLITPPKKLTLEEAITYLEDDEWIEITPQNCRLRKKILEENKRKRNS